MTYNLSKEVPKEIHPKFLGKKLDEKSFDFLIDNDADVYTPEGALLLRFRKKCLPGNLAEEAFPVLAKIKTKSLNRGTATGELYKKALPIKKDGTISKTTQVPKDAAVMSSVIGFYDRYPRIPFCRQTAFNANEPEGFRKVLPFIQAIDTAYRTIDEERYEKQMDWARRTSKDFVIPNTAFTTVTVNQNFRTAVHTDQGDLKEGLSCITVLRAGEYQGGYLVFPHYRVAVKLDTCDLLLFDSHHMHGNSPLFGKLGSYTRVSLVLYYREGMIECGTAAEELQRAKTRRLGDPL